MGVDFTAILDHHLTGEDLYALPERLNASWVLPADLAPWVAKCVQGGSTRWEWNRMAPSTSLAEELREEGHLRLDGPDGFHGRVLHGGIELLHLARWWSFLYEPDVQAGLQSACRIIASRVGAEHILYLPDNLFPPSSASDVLFTGGSVPDAISWLRSRVRAAVPDPAVFLGREEDHPDELAWFYEHRAG